MLDITIDIPWVTPNEEKLEEIVKIIEDMDI
ncbi:hypothetical protein X953_09980 [Virgibacillus sp. SK37]|nr:hypothetical protein X953_09980 [Virgibacillus sp. SK37]